MSEHGPRPGESPEAFRKRFLEEHKNEDITGMVAGKRAELEEDITWLTGTVAPAYLLHVANDGDPEKMMQGLERFSRLSAGLKMFGSILETLGRSEFVENIRDGVESPDDDS